MFYCGFGASYCGQSTTDDVNPGVSTVILAFVNTQIDGSVKMDEENFPHSAFSGWKTAGKKVLISVGGENGNWQNVYASDANTQRFVDSLVDIVKRFKLDGVDLDIESFSAAPTLVAKSIKLLKLALNKVSTGQLLLVSPQCVTVYQGEWTIPSLLTGSGAWNYFVNIIDAADQYIDYYQVQAYNDWYGSPAGSLDYLKNVYLNWRNLPDLNTKKPINNVALESTSSGNKRFRGVSGDGVAGSKLVIGVLASTRAGNSAFYAPPSIIN